ncbi:MAG TPA: protoheme IX farnesyltransferase [Deltaproteobacteria bacterium]|nr:protoheme IX farnesyltransferase [Deltaproteobacteria bacterium]
MSEKTANLGEVAVAQPGRLADFVVLTKPRLLFMVLVSTCIGYALAEPVRHDPLLILGLVFGTGLVGAAAHVFNQWWEVERDGLMVRTRNRPLPKGRVALEEAFWLGTCLAVSGLLLLVWSVNLLTALLGLVTLLSYILVYTPLKPLTPANTWVGAVTGALPPVMGWTAATGELGWAALPIFLLLYFWQLPHFFAIAWMHREDYARGGFRMLSHNDPQGQRTARHTLINSVLLLLASVSIYWAGQAGYVYLAGSLLLGLGALGYAGWFFWNRTYVNARRVFLMSIVYFPVLCVVVILDRILL